MRSRIVCLIAIVGLLGATELRGDVIGFENFDGGAINLTSTTNVFDYDPTGVGGAGTGGALGDVFGVVSSVASGGVGGPFDVWDDSVANNSGGGIDAGDSIGLAGQNTSAFFALNDADGSTTSGATFATWSFNVSSATEITDIQIDIGALGDFEAGSSDGFLIEAQLDGGGFQEIFRAVTDESAFKTYRPNDAGNSFADDDPLALFIDGATTSVGFLDKSDAVTGLFDTYASTLFAGLSGSNLDIRISFAGTPSGSEPQGIDNITINGNTVPEPSTLGVIALLAGFGLVRRKK